MSPFHVGRLFPGGLETKREKNGASGVCLYIDSLFGCSWFFLGIVCLTPLYFHWCWKPVACMYICWLLCVLADRP